MPTRKTLLLLGLFATTAGYGASVDTTSGTVQGETSGGIISFKGIPYGHAERWRSPVAAKRSRQTIDATQYGASCLQPTVPERPVGPTAEDCLSLNVWTPGIDSKRRPVLVWIHGGGFRTGSGQIPGEVFAAQDTVLVSINYRLGPLGFFRHPVVSSNDTANFGLEDMVLALKWVQDNVAAFGGDPYKVTIFGVSAGGMAVNLLMVNPDARGLFQRAIAQSGYATWALPRTENAPEPGPAHMDGSPAVRAEELATSLVGKLTDKRQSRRVLQRLDGQALVDAVDGFHLPIVDGVTLPEEPGLLFQRGQQANVPYMTGGNRWEGSVMPGSGISIETFAAQFGEQTDTLLSLYADDAQQSSEQALQRAFGDNRYLLSARTLAASMAQLSAPSYTYYIEYGPGPYAELGTPHGFDALLLFSAAPEDPTMRNLGVRMRQYWTDFAKRGRPESPGLTEWLAYHPTTDRWMVFGASDRVQQHIIKDKLDFLEAHYNQRVAPTRAN